MLKIGDTVPLELGGSAEVLEVLGQGGQGMVYRVRYSGHDFALKMYFQNKLRRPELFHDNLRQLCEDKAIQTTNSAFLMPLYLTEETEEGFGFLMNLIPDDYSPFSDILNARVKFSGLYSVVNSAIRITSAFRDLHNIGRSYQDLNDGGFFIRASDGEVLICNCANISESRENPDIWLPK